MKIDKLPLQEAKQSAAQLAKLRLMKQLKADGKSLSEISKRLGMSYGETKRTLEKIDKYGVKQSLDSFDDLRLVLIRGTTLELTPETARRYFCVKRCDPNRVRLGEDEIQRNLLRLLYTDYMG